MFRVTAEFENGFTGNEINESNFMKMSHVISTAGAFTLVLGQLSLAAGTTAPYLELGAAGPQHWAVLDQGNFSLSNPNGFITGGLGDVSGNVSIASSSAMNGTVYLGSSAAYGGGNPAPTGGIVHNSSVPAADLSLANSAATYYNGLTANFTSAPSAGTVAPGVYKITGDWSPNGGTYTLTAGQVYVFDISGNFKPSSSSSALFINDTTPYDVIFNVAGNVQSSGGSSTYPNMDGVFLAQGQISLTAGYVDGEIISDTSINIASTGFVDGGPVPDGGSSMLLMSAAVGLLIAARRRFVQHS